MSRVLTLGLLVASIVPTFAQISSGCNPLNTTVACPPDPALGISHTWNFANDTLNNTGVWNITSGQINYNQGNAEFTIAERGQSPTVQSQFRFFWGQASVTMKAAKGQGIVSSLTYLSDDLDEVDWEWIGGNDSFVQTNYFGKGNTKVYDRAVWVPVNDATGSYHNYSINWNQNVLEWIIDGNVVRSLPVASADDHGKQFPQTPLDVRMGIWAGGDDTLPGVSNWTAQWAGGMPDYSQAPFTMSVQALTVNDGTHGASTYTYEDTTGNWQSIKVAMGNSSVVDAINAPPPQSIAQKISNLSTGAKIGIACAAGAVVLGLVACCTVSCLRRRKQRRLDRQAANSQMLAYRQSKVAGDPAMSRPIDTAGDDSLPMNPDPFSDSKTDLIPGPSPSLSASTGKEFGHYAGAGHAYPLSPLSPVSQASPAPHAMMQQQHLLPGDVGVADGGGRGPAPHWMNSGNGNGGYFPRVPSTQYASQQPYRF